MLKRIKLKSFVINLSVLFVLLYSLFKFTKIGRTVFNRMGSEAMTIAMYSSVILAFLIAVSALFKKENNNESSSK